MSVPNSGKRGRQAKSVKKSQVPSGVILPKLTAEETWKSFKKPRVPKTKIKLPTRSKSKHRNTTTAILPTSTKKEDPRSEVGKTELSDLHTAIHINGLEECLLEEDQLKRLQSQFELADTGQGLSWSDIRSLAASEHITAEYASFKRVEKDRTTKLEFEDVLRVLFPKIKVSNIKRLVKNLSSVDNDRSTDRCDTQRSDAAVNLDEEQLKDLRDIFDYFCSFSSQEGAGDRSQQQLLPRETLRNALLSNPHIHDCITKEVLTFQDFADLMYQASNGVSNPQKVNIHYCFVPKPQPIPEL
eukprot:TRINITY_DN29053_c0_g1_i1.p1 TRINITY_DN29053_c0_g1~~TRINITY_DN29053_c0_g1_i1.p1  ORF type:complete len:299 (+),score=53.67 TRINITY_DN29053_c0_g1_i1:31-927(+)